MVMSRKTLGGVSGVVFWEGRGTNRGFPDGGRMVGIFACVWRMPG